MSSDNKVVSERESLGLISMFDFNWESKEVILTKRFSVEFDDQAIKLSEAVTALNGPFYKGGSKSASLFNKLKKEL